MVLKDSSSSTVIFCFFGLSASVLQNLKNINKIQIDGIKSGHSLPLLIVAMQYRFGALSASLEFGMCVLTPQLEMLQKDHT